MTQLLQRAAARATRGLRRSPVGFLAVRAAKLAAGVCFDVFKGQYETEGMRFTVPKDQTTRSMRGRFLADTYEWPERTLVKRHLPGRCRVLELGGGLGVLSCVVNRLLDDPTAHVVVEANPALIPLLVRHRRTNGARFAIENCVVSRETSARLAVGRDLDSSSVGADGIPVATKSLEEIEAAHRVTFDAIVMDIEGGEAEFIVGHPAKLRQLRFLMIEFHADGLGSEGVERLRGRLRDVGLHRRDQLLATEVYTRTP
jgi:FkbM family methyltransferase